MQHNTTRRKPNLPPRVIPFNALDHDYLIPETDDFEGVHLPACYGIVVPLRASFTEEAAAAALERVDTHRPELRVGYRLAVARNQFERVASHERGAFFASMVRRLDSTLELPQASAMLVNANPFPLQHPLTVYLQGRRLLLHIHHTLGDGHYGLRVTAALLHALHDPNGFAAQSNAPAPFSYPMWRIVFRSPAQMVGVVRAWAVSLRAQLREYQSEITPSALPHCPPVMTGSPLCVRFATITPDGWGALNTLRQTLAPHIRITLNTLLQVLVAERLIELGLTTPPIKYTIPVDLRRYLPAPANLIPGNLSGHVRVWGCDSFDLAHECAQLQTAVDERLARFEPLASLPFVWLYRAVVGSKRYKRVNRDWMLKSVQGDPRYFILSNLGILDAEFAPIVGALSDDGVQVVAPIMGKPPLAITLNTWNGRGNVTITSNPCYLTAEAMSALVDLFSTASLQARLARFQVLEQKSTS